jgi:UDPglucose 6-dehydrogenase
MDKSYKIVVAGTGYVGLVTAVCMAEVGHNVVCVDKMEEKISILQSGKSPIYEPGLEELMQKNIQRLIYTTDYKSAYRDADVIFIAVGTPEQEDGSANLNFVHNVSKEIAKSLEKDCVVVVKSTVPIGTNDDVEKFIHQN